MIRKWSFVIELENWMEVRELVEDKAHEVVGALGGIDTDRAVYRVIATFYQKKSRWLTNDPSIPRQDWGIDLDNVLKPIFDGLGPIIGYRKDWSGDKNHPGVLDSNIVELIAKKVNSGSEKEFLGIEIELIYISQSL